jgi:hypothetical protein
MELIFARSTLWACMNTQVRVHLRERACNGWSGSIKYPTDINVEIRIIIIMMPDTKGHDGARHSIENSIPEHCLLENSLYKSKQFKARLDRGVSI